MNGTKSSGQTSPDGGRQESLHGLWAGDKPLSERDWRRIFDSFTDPVAVLDRSFHIVYANKAMADRIGCGSEDCRGRPCYQCLHRSRSPISGCPNLETLRDGKPHSAEVCVEAWGGQYSVTTMPIFSDDGDIQGTVHVAHGLTHQRLEERRMTEAQRTESLRVMAGGLAHELNNVIHVILANARLLEGSGGIPAPVKLNLDEMIGSSMRAAELAKQLLVYAGRSVSTTSPLDLNAVVAQQEVILRGLAGWRAKPAFEYAKNLPSTAGDGEQVAQALQALVLNALEAVSTADDRVVVRTGYVRADRAYLDSCVLGCTLESGECVFLEVEDSGCGMTQPTVDHLFDPFFTTKVVGRGMGLPAVLGIVRSHGGAISVKSTVGYGTNMRLLFPVRVAPAPRHPAASDVDPARSSLRDAVLVVDDEPAILRILEVLVRSVGHRPVSAFDGVEAMEKFALEPERFSAAVLDVTMPRRNGAELARMLHAQRRDLPIVLCSGFAEDEVRAMVSDLTAEVTVVHKPYEISKMRDILAGLVTAPRKPS